MVDAVNAPVFICRVVIDGDDLFEKIQMIWSTSALFYGLLFRTLGGRKILSGDVLFLTAVVVFYHRRGRKVENKVMEWTIGWNDHRDLSNLNLRQVILKDN